MLIATFNAAKKKWQDILEKNAEVPKEQEASEDQDPEDVFFNQDQIVVKMLRKKEDEKKTSREASEEATQKLAEYREDAKKFIGKSH